MMILQFSVSVGQEKSYFQMIRFCGNQMKECLKEKICETDAQ